MCVQSSTLLFKNEICDVFLKMKPEVILKRDGNISFQMKVFCASKSLISEQRFCQF
jgi:hypothetical protein